MGFSPCLSSCTRIPVHAAHRACFFFGCLREDPLDSVPQVFGCVMARLIDPSHLSAAVAIHVNDPGLERAQRPLHPAELLGVRILPDLHLNLRRFAVVVLVQHQAVVLSQPHHMSARFLQQSRIGRVCNRLGHHGRVHDYPIRAG